MDERLCGNTKYYRLESQDSVVVVLEFNLDLEDLSWGGPPLGWSTTVFLSEQGKPPSNMSSPKEQG